MAVSLWPLADVLQLGGDKISDPSLTVQEAKAIIAHALQLKRKADWEWPPRIMLEVSVSCNLLPQYCDPLSWANPIRSLLLVQMVY